MVGRRAFLGGVVAAVGLSVGFTVLADEEQPVFTAEPGKYYEITAQVRADAPCAVSFGAEGSDICLPADERWTRRTYVYWIADETCKTNLQVRAKAKFKRIRSLPGRQIETRDWRIRVITEQEARLVAPECRFVKPAAEPQPAFAKNKIVNSSFELGLAAHGTFTTVPYLKGDDRTARGDVTLDRTNPFHGEFSLKVDNMRGTTGLAVKAAECWRQPGQSYVYSVWLRAEKETAVKLKVADVTTDPLVQQNFWYEDGREVKVSNEWTRCSFAPGKVPPAGNLKFVPSVIVPAGAVVWMDAEQFEAVDPKTKEASPYVPAAAAEAAWVMDETVIVGTNGSHMAELRKVWYGPEKVRCETETRSVETSRYGVFALDGMFEGHRIFPFDYCVIHPLPVKPLPKAPRCLGDEGFYVGINGGHGVEGECADKQHYDVHSGSVLEDTFVRLRQFGLRMVRLHDGGLTWYDIQQEPGKCRWEVLDRVVDGCRRQGLEPMYVLGNGGVFLRKPSGDRKDGWFVRKNGRKSPAKSVMPWVETVLPSDEDWVAFTRELVRRYRGKIRYYETINEPNLQICDGKIYRHYLELTWKTVKDEDPEAIVVGICSTGDFGGQAAKFIEETGELGGFKFFDILSFHPYCAGTDVSPTPADEMLGDIRKLVEKYRPGCPMLEDEIYYLGHPYHNRNHNRDMNWPASYLIRRYCLDAAGGCEGSVPANGFRMQGACPETPSLAWTYNYNFRFRGSDVFVAGNAFAHFLEGSRYLERPSLPAGVNGVTFRSARGERITVLWAKEDFDVRDWRVPEGESAFDMFGNPLVGPRIRLGIDPVYLIRGR